MDTGRTDVWNPTPLLAAEHNGGLFSFQIKNGWLMVALTLTLTLTKQLWSAYLSPPLYS